MSGLGLLKLFAFPIVLMAVTCLATAQTRTPTPPTNTPSATPGICALPEVSGSQESLRILLDGKSATPAQRRAEFAAYERCAQKGIVYAEDLIGSLYYMGDDLPDALVTRDVDKARLYLGNAAAHGDILDMAKMAEIEYAGQHYEAAMVWAQLFVHYSTTKADNGRPPGYAAALLQRLFPHVSKKEMGDITNDINAFVAQFDNVIHTYNFKLSVSPAGDDMRWANSKIEGPLPSYTGVWPESGFAEFLVAFRSNGTTDGAWIIDAFPNINTGRGLLPGVSRMRLAATSRPGLRYVTVPVIYSNNGYQIKGNETTSSR